MNKDNWYIIDDLDSFVLSTRKLLFNNFGKTKGSESVMGVDLLDIKPEEQEEFDSILTQEESMIIAKNILKRQHHKYTKNIRYLVSDSIYLRLVENMNDRMVSNILNNLVNKGYLESAYDSESDDFVFWIKDEDKPETD